MNFSTSMPRLSRLMRPLVLSLLAATVLLPALDAEAARMGRGRAVGMQRQMPDKAPPTNTANQATTPAASPTQATAPMAGAAATGAAAQAGRRSWMGPIAGLAAGLGLAALAHSLGFGEAFGNIMTMALLLMVALFALRWFMSRRSGAGAAANNGLAMAGAGAGGAVGSPMAKRTLDPAPYPSAVPSSFNAGAASTSAAQGQQLNLPPDFDAAGFERVAKMIFIRLQAANDTAELDDLRKFTTPELFAALRLDLQDRDGAAQQTDVVQLSAEVLDMTKDADQWIVTVRYQGLIREAMHATAQPFDELWHLVKPADGSRDWAIAGITPQS